MPWWLWVLLGVLALAGESVSMALFLLYVGVAAFVAAVLAALGLSAAAQVGVFVVVAVALIALIRPRMLQALAGRVPHRTLTNQGRLSERSAVVTQTVTAESGMIRVGNAEFWSARARPPATRLAVGSPVRIMFVEGLTAYVDPLPLVPDVPESPNDPILPESAAAPAGLAPAEMARESAREET